MNNINHIEPSAIPMREALKNAIANCEDCGVIIPQLRGKEASEKDEILNGLRQSKTLLDEVDEIAQQKRMDPNKNIIKSLKDTDNARTFLTLKERNDQKLADLSTAIENGTTQQLEDTIADIGNFNSYSQQYIVTNNKNTLKTLAEARNHQGIKNILTTKFGINFN